MTSWVFRFLRLIWAFALIPIISVPALSADHCEAELNTLKSIAADIDVRFLSDPVIAAGDPISVNWSRGGDFPGNVSAWLMIVSIDAVRFSGSGFYPLPGGTPGPLDAKFANKWTRTIVPLHTPDAPSDGQFGIKPYREGNFGLSWTVIAKSDCGEMQLRDVGAYKIKVEARKARIVVQDLYDYTRPSRIIQSGNGRHELRVFDGYYQVFDRRSGGKVLDRQGRCPEFSPTGRFVAALSGRSAGECSFYTAGENKPKFEVIDLVSGDIVANPDPPALWAYGDAFLIVPSKWWKMLQGPGFVTSLLVDAEDGKSARLMVMGDTIAPRIDIANGYIYRYYKQQDEPVVSVFSLGGGGEISEHQVGWDEARSEAITSGPPVEVLLDAARSRTGTKPLANELGSDPQVMISHDRYLGNAAETFADAVEEESVESLIKRRVVHKTIDSGEGLQPRDDRILTASLLRGASVLASARTAGRTIEGLVNDRLRARFVPQLRQKNAVGSIVDKVQQIDRLQISDDEKRKRFNTFKTDTVEPVKFTLAAEMQGSSYVLQQLLGCWPSGGAPYGDNLMGIWSRVTDKRMVWLTHAGCQGIGTVGNLALNQIDLFIREDGQTRHYNLIFDRQFYCAGNGVECEYFFQDDEEDEFDITRKEQGYGALRPGENMVADRLGAKIPQSFQQLIEFDDLKPAFLSDRYLLLPIGSKMFIVDLDNKTMDGPIDLLADASNARFSLSSDRQHFMQVNEDGSLAIHDFKTGKVALNGRYVDDEIVIWDSYGHYLSTNEGAQFAHMRFVGRPEIYSLSQMAGSLNRPDLVRAALDQARPVEAPDLAAPPRLSTELKHDPSIPGAEIAVTANSQTELRELRVFADGVLAQTVAISDREWQGVIEVENLPKADWLSLVAVDQNGFESAADEIRLPDRDAESGNLFVVAIGTDTYEDSDNLSRLGFAVSDAQNFVNAVDAASGGRYRSKTIFGPFLDSSSLDRQLQAALADISAQAAPGDTVMVFVAGHGIRGDDGQFYLATRTTRLDNLAGTGLPWSKFAGQLAGLRTRTFVFLDACHSGSVGQATNDGAIDALLGAANGSLTVIAASKGRQYSLESPSVGGGYFTSAIASILNRAEDAELDRDGSGTMDLDELYLALKKQVVEQTEGRQTPWIARAKIVGKVPLF